MKYSEFLLYAVLFALVFLSLITKKIDWAGFYLAALALLVALGKDEE